VSNSCDNAIIIETILDSASSAIRQHRVQI